MIPSFRDEQNSLQIKERTSSHYSPHLHNSIEFIYITSGSLVLGEGIDLFEMKKGDLAVIFPNVIHHFQVFSKGENRAIHLLAKPSLLEGYLNLLTSKRPRNPVISKADVHENIIYSIKNLMELSESDETSPVISNLQRAFILLILSRTFPLLELYEREDNRIHDIVYRVVSYIAMHYPEDISLTSIAKDLGISQFSLSRVFSSTFHQNFNHYLNNVRLEYVVEQLSGSSKAITDIAMDAGFQSQTTFNRVFQETYHMTPREYRNALL